MELLSSIGKAISIFSDYLKIHYRLSVPGRKQKTLQKKDYT